MNLFKYFIFLFFSIRPFSRLRSSTAIATVSSTCRPICGVWAPPCTTAPRAVSRSDHTGAALTRRPCEWIRKGNVLFNDALNTFYLHRSWYYGSSDRSFMGWTHWAISRSSQCSTTGVNKGCGMYYPVCGMMHIKEPLLLIGKSSPCGGCKFQTYG